MGSTTAYVEKSCLKPFTMVLSDKLPQVMSLESASVGSEKYKFENEKNLGECS